MERNMSTIQAFIFRLPEEVEERLNTALLICGIAVDEKHRHGTGPLHSEIPVSSSFVTELYPKSKNGKFSSLVLVATVDDLEKTKTLLDQACLSPKSEALYLLLEIEEEYLQLQIWDKKAWDSFK